MAAGKCGGDRFGGQQPSTTDHDEVVGEHLELTDQVARDENGPAGLCEGSE